MTDIEYQILTLVKRGLIKPTELMNYFRYNSNYDLAKVNIAMCTLQDKGIITWHNKLNLIPGTHFDKYFNSSV